MFCQSLWSFKLCIEVRCCEGMCFATIEVGDLASDNSFAYITVDHGNGSQCDALFRNER